VRWLVDRAPESVELRLFWYTRGKGTQDAEVVGCQGFESPRAEDGRQFSLELPASPYSFSGELITLVWAAELVVSPPGEVARVEFVMSPEGRDVHPRT